MRRFYILLLLLVSCATSAFGDSQSDTSKNYTKLGYSLRDAGSSDKAILAFSQAITANPTSASAFLGLGFSLFDSKDYEAAIDNFTNAIRLDPQWAIAYGGRGVAYERGGYLDLAASDLKKMLALSPGERDTQDGKDALARVESALLTQNAGQRGASMRSNGYKLPRMVPGSSVGNDPAKEQLCISRGSGAKTTLPFEIDADYVAGRRKSHPDITFVVVGRSLVECWLNEGTGKYGPNEWGPENSDWHFVRPEGPGIDTPQAQKNAARACLSASIERWGKEGLDHSVSNAILEVGAGALVAGQKAESYDFAVTGTSFYKSDGPDLASVQFTCLFSRSHVLRGVGLGRYR